MIDEPFAQGKSLFHLMDPRAKFIVALCFSIIVAVSKNPYVPAAGLFFALMLASIARLSLRPLIKRLIAVNIFTVMLWTFLPFTQPGTTFFVIGPFSASAEGIALALSITMKTNAIIVALAALLSTSPIFELAHALDHLFVPRKLVQLLFFTWRYVHVNQQQFQSLRKAMRARCFAPTTSMHTYRSYGYLLGMLLVRSLDRSDRIYKAMLCRGFYGFFPAYRHFHWRKRDSFALIGLFGIILCLGAIEWIR